MKSGDSHELSVAIIGIYVSVIAIGIELFLFGITAGVGSITVNPISVTYASVGVITILVGMYYLRRQKQFIKREGSSQPSPPVIVQVQFPSLMRIEAHVKVDGKLNEELNDTRKE